MLERSANPDRSTLRVAGRANHDLDGWIVPHVRPAFQAFLWRGEDECAADRRCRGRGALEPDGPADADHGVPSARRLGRTKLDHVADGVRVRPQPPRHLRIDDGDRALLALEEITAVRD